MIRLKQLEELRNPFSIQETKAENTYVFDMSASKRMDEAHLSEL